MQRSFAEPITSQRHAVRGIATQTDTRESRTHSRQTQTEPHLCLDCHTAQLVELLRPGRPGRVPARPDDFAGSELFAVEEKDENVEPEVLSAETAAGPTPAEVLAASLCDPHGQPLPHALHDPDLLRVVLSASPQSLAGRTAE